MYKVIVREIDNPQYKPGPQFGGIAIPTSTNVSQVPYVAQYGIHASELWDENVLLPSGQLSDTYQYIAPKQFDQVVLQNLADGTEKILLTGGLLYIDKQAGSDEVLLYKQADANGRIMRGEEHFTTSVNPSFWTYDGGAWGSVSVVDLSTGKIIASDQNANNGFGSVTGSDVDPFSVKLTDSSLIVSYDKAQGSFPSSEATFSQHLTSLTVPLSPHLFTEDADTVNFNNLNPDQAAYIDKQFAQSGITDFLYDAHDGGDTVTLPDVGPNGQATIRPGILWNYDKNFYAGAGDDVIHGGTGNNRIDGGPGSDHIFGGSGSNWIYGGSDGTQSGPPSHDYLYGGTDKNTLIAGPNQTDLDATASKKPNILLGNSGDDRLLGGSDTDYLYAGSGTNEVYGGGGDDIIYGSRTDFTKVNVPGLTSEDLQYIAADTANTGKAATTVHGGKGFNTLVYTLPASQLHFILHDPFTSLYSFFWTPEVGDPAFIVQRKTASVGEFNDNVYSDIQQLVLDGTTFKASDIAAYAAQKWTIDLWGKALGWLGLIPWQGQELVKFAHEIVIPAIQIERDATIASNGEFNREYIKELFIESVMTAIDKGIEAGIGNAVANSVGAVRAKIPIDQIPADFPGSSDPWVKAASQRWSDLDQSTKDKLIQTGVDFGDGKIAHLVTDDLNKQFLENGKLMLRDKLSEIWDAHVAPVIFGPDDAISLPQGAQLTQFEGNIDAAIQTDLAPALLQFSNDGKSALKLDVDTEQPLPTTPDGVIQDIFFNTLENSLGSPSSPADAQPIIGPLTLLTNTSVNVSSIIVPPSGVTVQAYQFEDHTSDPTSGHFSVKGVVQPANQPFTVAASDLSSVSFVAGPSTVGDTIAVKIETSNQWSDWTPATVYEAKTITDLSTPQDKNVYLVYQAAFGRIPDEGGLRYWAGVADSGHTSITDIASQFASSVEFGQKFGTNLPNSDYVSHLYSNVLGRAPDSTGLSYWTDRANSGESRAQLLVDFAMSAENGQNTASHLQNGWWVY